MMKLSSVAFAFLLTSFFTSTACSGQKLEAWPAIVDSDAKPWLVVANISSGHSLRPFPECANQKVICMDPPPFTLELKIIQTIYGEQVDLNIEAATTSHSGMRSYENEGPYLVLIKTDKKHFIIPKYAMLGLTTNKSGEQFIIRTGSYLPAWLPCAIDDLQQEIDPTDFEHLPQIKIEDLSKRSSETLNKYYRLTEKAAVPRFAISLVKLSNFLAATQPGLDDISCRAKK